MSNLDKTVLITLGLVVGTLHPYTNLDGSVNIGGVAIFSVMLYLCFWVLDTIAAYLKK